MEKRVKKVNNKIREQCSGSLAAVERVSLYKQYKNKRCNNISEKWKEKSEIKIRGEPPTKHFYKQKR